MDPPLEDNNGSGGDEAGETAGSPELTNQNEIIQMFAAMREEVNALWGKMTELGNEASEHQQVLKALEPMEGGRKCFRLVGDVLVERTVEEVLPAVRKNEEGIHQVLESYSKQLEAKRKALAEFQTKYKIRVKGEDFDEDEEQETEAKTANNTSQGVLVSTT